MRSRLICMPRSHQRELPGEQRLHYLAHQDQHARGGVVDACDKHRQILHRPRRTSTVLHTPVAPGRLRRQQAVHHRGHLLEMLPAQPPQVGPPVAPVRLPHNLPNDVPRRTARTARPVDPGPDEARPLAARRQLRAARSAAVGVARGSGCAGPAAACGAPGIGRAVAGCIGRCRPGRTTALAMPFRRSVHSPTRLRGPSLPCPRPDLARSGHCTLTRGSTGRLIEHVNKTVLATPAASPAECVCGIGKLVNESAVRRGVPGYTRTQEYGAA